MDVRKIVSIVIVNWNAGEQLKEAIVSLAEFGNGCIADVVIVDNHSSDDSLSLVETMRDLPFALLIVRNDANMGFGYACNQGARLCQSEFLLFLNPDTRIEKNSLAVPLHYLQQPQHASSGICGIRLVDETGRTTKSCSRFPTPFMFFLSALGLNRVSFFRRWGHHMEEWDHASSRKVDQVIGAFFLVRKAVYEQLNGFDERFFVYFEEVDFSLRAHQAGWRSMYLADAQAFHAGGGTSRQVKARRLFYSLRSRLLYGLKHFSVWQAGGLFVTTLLLEPCSRLAFALVCGSLADAANVGRAYTMLWRALPDIMKGIGR